jgi:hypothetical protein
MKKIFLLLVAVAWGLTFSLGAHAYPYGADGTLTQITDVPDAHGTPHFFQDSDGMYMDAYRGYNDPGIFIKTSIDGIDWSEPVTVTALEDSQGPYVGQDADGRYWIAFMHSSGEEWVISTTGSNDGLTWDTPVPAVTGATVQMGSMMIDDAGMFWLAYNTVDGIYLTSSEDGSTWDSSQSIVPLPEAFGARLSQDLDGSYWMAYNTGRTTTAAAYVVRSEDALTWEAPVLVSSLGTFVSNVVDAGSEYLIAYGNERYYDIFIASSADGYSWTELGQFSEITSEYRDARPYLLIDTSGKQWMTFQSNDNDEATTQVYVYVEAPAIASSIDIKPQSCPNPLNVNSGGLLPVAVLGSQDFDVTEIDVSSIRLLDVAPKRSNMEDVATPHEPNGYQSHDDCNDYGPDGFADLTLKFDKKDIVEALGEVDDGDVLVFELTGTLSDGTQFTGEDVVIIRKKGKK